MRVLVLVLSTALGAFVATAQSDDAQERARLLDVQRAAVTQLQQAAREGTPADQVQRALVDARRNVDTLAAADRLPAPMRDDLKRAAADLNAVASKDPREAAAATRPILALLEKVRAQLAGDVALGLTFQG